MKPSELLAAGRKFIERGWAVGAYGRDSEQRSIEPTDSSVVCWCASGALYAAQDRRIGLSTTSLQKRAQRFLLKSRHAEADSGDRYVGAINDRLTSQAYALAWFDDAIKLAQEAGE